MPREPLPSFRRIPLKWHARLVFRLDPYHQLNVRPIPGATSPRRLARHFLERGILKVVVRPNGGKTLRWTRWGENQAQANEFANGKFLPPMMAGKKGLSPASALKRRVIAKSYVTTLILDVAAARLRKRLVKNLPLFLLFSRGAGSQIPEVNVESIVELLSEEQERTDIALQRLQRRKAKRKKQNAFFLETNRHGLATEALLRVTQDKSFFYECMEEAQKCWDEQIQLHQRKK